MTLMLCLLKLFQNIFLSFYQTMLGPSDIHIIGRLKDWDITSRLGSISIPCLLTSGQYDEFTPTQAAVVRDGIPNCTSVLFEKSAHMAHAEETERYLSVLNNFLTLVEKQVGLISFEPEYSTYV